eukprot:1236380-Karenia_brevis.AAC.1
MPIKYVIPLVQIRRLRLVLKLSNKRLLKAAPKQALRPSFPMELVMIMMLRIMTIMHGGDGVVTKIMIMIGTATGMASGLEHGPQRNLRLQSLLRQRPPPALAPFGRPRHTCPCDGCYFDASVR